MKNVTQWQLAVNLPLCLCICGRNKLKVWLWFVSFSPPVTVPYFRYLCLKRGKEGKKKREKKGCKRRLQIMTDRTKFTSCFVRIQRWEILLNGDEVRSERMDKQFVLSVSVLCATHFLIIVDVVILISSIIDCS